MTLKPIDVFEKKLASFIKKAKKRKKKAKKSKVARYFEGQQDAFEQVLIELKNLKYELETHVAEDEHDDEVEREVGESISATEKGERLLQAALDSAIITRKTSFYFYEGFPSGKVQGKKRVFEQLSDESLAEKITRQIAEARAVSSA